MQRNIEWYRRCESLDSRPNVGIVRELSVDLAILIVRTVNRLQRKELNRIWRKVGRVPLVPCLCRTVLNLIGGTRKTGNLMPWPSEGERELINMPSRGIRLHSLMCKQDIAHRIDLGVGSTGVDKFTVPCSLFLNKDFSNFT